MINDPMITCMISKQRWAVEPTSRCRARVKEGLEFYNWIMSWDNRLIGQIA